MIKYFIAPPLSPWDREHEEKILLSAAEGSLASNPGMAWYRHTRGKMEQVQHWHDRGYRLRRVEVQLLVD